MNFLLPLIGLVSGILAGNWLHSIVWGMLPIAFAVMTYLVLIKKSKIPLKALKLKYHHSIWILSMFAGIGILTSWYHKPMTVKDNLLESMAAADGEIVSVNPYASGDRFTVDILRLADKNGNIINCRNLRVLLITDGFSANIGDIIIFPIHLENIKDNKNFRSRGYADRMKRLGLNYRSYVSSEDIKIKASSNSIKSHASSYRDKLEILIEKSSLERPTSEFIISILLGDRSFLSSETRDSFSNAGVGHIFSLSGMHVAIMMGIFLFILFPLNIIGFQKARYLCALTLIWGYAYFTGLAPSTVRACIMASFMVLAILFQRRNASANSLLGAAFIILFIDPMAIYDVGLQLSFLCVGCILVFAGPLNTVNERSHPRWHAFTSFVLVSMVTTLGTWVLISYYFQKVPLLFLPANLLLVPLLPIFLGMSLLYLVLIMLGIDLDFLSWTLDKCYLIFSKTSEYISSFGNSTIEYQSTLPVIVLWLAGVLMIGYSLKRKKKLFSVTIGAGMFAGSIALIPSFTNSQDDGMIVQKNFSAISVALYDNNKERIAEFPRNSVSRIVHEGCEILSLDCPIKIDSVFKATISQASLKKRNKRYLILGSGCTNLKLEDIPGLKDFEKVFIHSSIKKKRESAIMEEALNLGLNQIYSLREEGPYEVNF